ncbi:hypothetical protein SNE25_05035 [Mucilaginibacter sabulilitoris]|uniref:Uncharacterized protein n=1 Tax=Mucilaginibacter sabulilitoris TaxID=1173583 RepID=A0ABZ0TRV6_9SPHI|nr:hypothetical protein [Mucilaginibacter sabulilitoris]WPU94883.1 hypothetical protein SNE25_05035 [Mucilaginibacter sabulilitoris]
MCFRGNKDLGNSRPFEYFRKTETEMDKTLMQLWLKLVDYLPAITWYISQSL